MILLSLLLLLAADVPRLSAIPRGVVHLVRRGASPARTTAYPDLCTALEAAADGDLLLLDPGLYAGPGNRDLVITKDVEIRGRLGAATAVIDCEGAGRAFDIQATAVLLEGLTIRRGQAYAGGGALVSSGTAVFKDVTFESNTADFGGGLADAYYSTVLLSECRFLGNEAAFSGGGMSASGTAHLESCLFEHNEAVSQFGGGLCITSDLPPQPVRASDCTFRENTSAQLGGGISVIFTGDLTLDRCELLDNASDAGGGLAAIGPFVIAFVFNSLVASNVAGTGAGGIHGGTVGVSNCTVVANKTSAGEAAGIRGGDSVRPAVVLNCVIRDNESNAATLFDQQIQPASGVAAHLSLTYSNVDGVVGLPTNFDADPMFLDPLNGDYHIAPGSPCVDAGFTFSLTNTQRDIDGEPRFQGLAVDVGADEVPVSR